MADILDLFPECRGGCVRLRFDLFLARVLYDPQHGYYCRPALRFGKGGDFYTSPHVHLFFAEILAEHFLQVWEEMGHPKPFVLLELGPGDGTLASQLLRCVQHRFEEFYEAMAYIGLEVSTSLAEQQGKKLESFPRVRIIAEKFTAAEIPPFEGFIFSNEFFDALPFRRLKREWKQWLEYFVEIKPNGIQGRWESTDWEPNIAITIPVGGILEWRDDVEDVYRFAAKTLRNGVMLHFDYGETRDNLNPAGTLRTFHRHRLGEDPFVRLGEQDITASVDFSHLIGLGDEHNLRSRLLNQREYLIERGILEKIALRFQDTRPDQIKVLEEKLALKNLIVPGGISDHFKVLIQLAGWQVRG